MPSLFSGAINMITILKEQNGNTESVREYDALIYDITSKYLLINSDADNNDINHRFAEFLSYLQGLPASLAVKEQALDYQITVLEDQYSSISAQTDGLSRAMPKINTFLNMKALDPEMIPQYTAIVSKLALGITKPACEKLLLDSSKTVSSFRELLKAHEDKHRIALIEYNAAHSAFMKQKEAENSKQRTMLSKIISSNPTFPNEAEMLSELYRLHTVVSEASTQLNNIRTEMGKEYNELIRRFYEICTLCANMLSKVYSDLLFKQRGVSESITDYKSRVNQIAKLTSGVKELLDRQSEY